jgi:hypothetical protein
MPLGPSAQYVVTYNSYQLPGYAQEKSDDSSMNIVTHYAPYVDGGQSEYTGLQNTSLAMKFKVWEPTFADCEAAFQEAKSYLYSKKYGWAELFIGRTDRYYKAKTQNVKRTSTAGSSVRLLEYDVNWETLPYQISVSGYTISGGGNITLNTDTIGRTILADGGWTPTTILLTGHDITISGYTDDDLCIGFISASGTLVNMQVNTESYTSTMAGANANGHMLWADYSMPVAPGKTYYAIHGSPATNVVISWNDRWY